MSNARQVLPRFWFAEHKQVFVHDEIELKVFCLRFPPLTVLGIVLGLDDFFL
jgi:hypothetical protein